MAGNFNDLAKMLPAFRFDPARGDVEVERARASC